MGGKTCHHSGRNSHHLRPPSFWIAWRYYLYSLNGVLWGAGTHSTKDQLIITHHIIPTFIYRLFCLLWKIQKKPKQKHNFAMQWEKKQARTIIFTATCFRLVKHSERQNRVNKKKRKQNKQIRYKNKQTNTCNSVTTWIQCNTKYSRFKQGHFPAK